MQTYVACQECTAINRVDLERSAHRQAKCAKCHKILPLHGGVSEVTARSLEELIKKSPLPVVVDFWAPWCGPCHAFAPTFSQVATQLADKIVFTKLNTEQHQAAAARYGIRGIPTSIVFQDGLEKERQSGAMSLIDFSKWLKAAIDL